MSFVEYVRKNRPIQIIHSFEGLINGLDGMEVMPFGRPRPYDTSNFEERVTSILADLASRGIGGISVNVGYDGYLGNEEAWKRFLFGIEKAVELGLRIWIYDENGYPSGSAGGQVVGESPDYEASGIKLLVMSDVAAPFRITLPDSRARVFAVYGSGESGGMTQLSVENESNEVTIKEGRFDKVEVYFNTPLFHGAHACNPETSCKPYMNVLDRDAVNAFLRLTHMKYFKKIPSHLWQHVQAVFTDEPSLMSHVIDPSPDDRYYPSVPWAKELDSVFFNRKGYVIADRIRSLFGGQDTSDQQVRRDFWEVVAEMYEESYSVQSSEICGAMDISWTGHLLSEDQFWQHATMQANPIGLLKHFQLPGIDVLTCRPERINEEYPLMCKLGSSAALLGGKPELMVEVCEYFEFWSEERIRRLRETLTYWEGPRDANPIEHIEYALALMFLTGVREFSFYFSWRAYSKEEYRRLCDFVNRLNSLGRGAAFKAEYALYYPIENIWEEYIPNDLDIIKSAMKAQSNRVRHLNDTMFETCKDLQQSNVQYIFADSKHVAKLPELGIHTLLFLHGEKPSSRISQFCKKEGIRITELGDSHIHRLPGSLVKDVDVESGIVFQRYEGFAFLVNTKQDELSFTVKNAEVIFPAHSDARERASGKLTLPAYQCAFVFDA